MSVARVYISAMTIAGLLAGLAATMTVLGRQNSLTDQVAGSIGFEAITVALLGRATPLGTVLAGLLFGALSAGGLAMQGAAGVPPGALPGAPGIDRVVRGRAGADPRLLPDPRTEQGLRRGRVRMGIMSTLQAPAAPAGGDEAVVRDRAGVRRQVRLVVTFAIAFALLVLFWVRVEDPQVSFILGERVTREFQPNSLNGSAISILAILVAGVALALAVLNRFPRGWAGALLGAAVGLSFYLGFLMWAYADQGAGFQAAIANPIPGTVRIATPLVFGALAGCLCERAGVINIAIEGAVPLGAFFASVFSSLAYASLVFIAGGAVRPFGLLGGMVAGMMIAALLGLFGLRYQVNQVVLGVVLVAFASGLTDFLLSQIPGRTGRTSTTRRSSPTSGSRCCPICRWWARRCSTRRCWST